MHQVLAFHSWCIPFHGPISSAPQPNSCVQSQINPSLQSHCSAKFHSSFAPTPISKSKSHSYSLGTTQPLSQPLFLMATNSHFSSLALPCSSPHLPVNAIAYEHPHCWIQFPDLVPGFHSPTYPNTYSSFILDASHILRISLGAAPLGAMKKFIAYTTIWKHLCLVLIILLHADSVT